MAQLWPWTAVPAEACSKLRADAIVHGRFVTAMSPVRWGKISSARAREAIPLAIRQFSRTGDRRRMR